MKIISLACGIKIYILCTVTWGHLGFKSVMGTKFRGHKWNYSFVVVYISVAVCWNKIWMQFYHNYQDDFKWLYLSDFGKQTVAEMIYNQKNNLNEVFPNLDQIVACECRRISGCHPSPPKITSANQSQETISVT